MNISQRERAGFFALILCVGIAAALSGCRSQPVRPEMTPTAPHFRVATYNINWGMPDSLREFDRYANTWRRRVLPLGGSDHYPVTALFAAAFSSP